MSSADGGAADESAADDVATLPAGSLESKAPDDGSEAEALAAGADESEAGTPSVTALEVSSVDDVAVDVETVGGGAAVVVGTAVLEVSGTTLGDAGAVSVAPTLLPTGGFEAVAGSAAGSHASTTVATPTASTPTANMLCGVT